MLKSISSIRAKEQFQAGVPFTPPKLITEMIDKVGVEVHSKVLVMFTVEAAAVLKHKGVEDVTIYTDKYDPVVAKIATYLNYEYITELDDMKFDVVIGNPPFSLGKKQLYPEFTTKAFEISTRKVAMIAPYNLNTRNKYQEMLRLIKTHSTHVSEDVGGHFPGVGASTFVYFVADKTITNEYVPNSKPVELPVHLPTKARLTGSIRGHNCLSFTKNQVESGVVFYHGVDKNMQIVTKQMTKEMSSKLKNKSQANWLVLLFATVSSGGKVNSTVVKNTGTTWGDGIYAFECESKEQAVALNGWLQSDEFRSAVDETITLNKRFRLTKQILESLPSNLNS